MPAPLPEGHPADRHRPDRRAAAQSRDARRRPTTGRCGAISREFLSDPRVIETNPLIWQPILQGVVLSTRPQKSGANYARIWDREANDSPLRVITRRQTEKLQAAAGRRRSIVDFAMRYGNPSTRVAARGAAEGGVPDDPARAALSAVFGDDHGDRQRQGVRGAGEDALAAGGAHGARLLRRGLLHRGAGEEHRRRRRGARLRARRGPHQLSRHAGDLSRARRPLPLPVPQDDAAGAREAGLAARTS